MTRLLFAALLSVLAVPAMAQVHRAATITPSVAVSTTAASTGTVTVKVINPQVNTLGPVTCHITDADGSSCDALPNLAIGASVASFTITGSPNPYTGTPTLTDPSGNFKISGGNIVAAKTPLPAGTYTMSIVP
jgi:hypothetical protein